MHCGFWQRAIWRAHAYDERGNGSMSVQSFIEGYGRGPFLKNIPPPVNLLTAPKNALNF